MSLQQILAEILPLRAEILSLRAEVASLKAMIGEGNTSSKVSVVSNSSSNAAGKKVKKEKRKAPKDENGNTIVQKWPAFMKRVSDLMKAAGLPKEQTGGGGIIFASQLKLAREDYNSYTDDEIKEALKGFVVPVIPKGGKKSKKDTTPAANISSPGDNEEAVVTTTNVASSSVGGSSSAVKNEEMDYGGDSDDETEAEDDDEATEDPIVFKGKKYFKNSKTGVCYHRLPEDVKGDYAGIFIEKDPITGKPKLDTTAPEPTA
jgi:hypothetical protein